MKPEEIIANFSKEHRRLWAMAYSICHDYHLCDDILQEVSITLIKKADDFDSERAFLPWAIGITRIQALRASQKKKLDKLDLSEDSLDIIEKQICENYQDEVLESRLQSLKSCLGKISGENYQILKMKYIKGESARQIAQSIGRSETATHSLLQRLRLSLQKCIISKAINS
ncbi:probable extracytoplasmic function alternative sigma factor [Lentisphaera araneosa HTCC2155]|uniref:Probable extracytoplasmic function alternative sigma factor n=1 Tax=Lentisphaera araneosa HTCC2155 TaxID=313628 RepID=A6DJR3_9BACT|nr:sigma-70 family RNA polymerase sigma factor [Lentisphaera araneosa]EDM28137.1 probable extracytoplasmic function alternative sigma factor [Lentisphaera araneosa HTCC2155]